MTTLDAHGHEPSSSDESSDSDEFFMYEHKGHATAFFHGYRDLWASSLLCDVTLCVDSEEFPCHKAVLAISSSYFMAMFTGHLSESKQDKVVLKDVDAQAVKDLLVFIYASKLVITDSSVYSLLAAANLLQILPAKTACETYLEGQLNADNCFWMYNIADTYACPDLYRKARDIIIVNFSALDIEKDLLELSAKQLIDVISSDMLDVESEEAVFSFIVRWHSKDPDRRSEDFDKILERVYLPVLSPSFLYEHVEQFPAVKNCAKCKGLIEEAKRFRFLPDKRGEMRPEWSGFRKYHAIQELIVSWRLNTNGPVELYHPMNRTPAIENMNVDLVLDEDRAVPSVVFGRLLYELPPFRRLQGLAGLENTLYFIGGESVDGAAIKLVDKYNLEMQIWTQMKSMIVPRCQPGIAMLNGEIYALGGRNRNDWMESVEYYNPQKNTWKSGVDMPVALQNITAVAFKGCIYASGIADVSTSNSAEEVKYVSKMLCFCSSSQCWSVLPQMPSSCYGTRACVIDNQICLVGGAVHTKVESYNPENKTWTSLPMLSSMMSLYKPQTAMINEAMLVGYHSCNSGKWSVFKDNNENGKIWMPTANDCKVNYTRSTIGAVLQVRKGMLDKHRRCYRCSPICNPNSGPTGPILSTIARTSMMRRLFSSAY